MSSVASSFHETILRGVGAGSRSRAKFRMLLRISGPTVTMGASECPAGPRLSARLDGRSPPCRHHGSRLAKPLQSQLG